MIVRMSKIEIVGPKGLLQGVLASLQESSVFQIEPTEAGFIESGAEEHIRSFLLDKETLSERLFLEDLRMKIDELFSYLPKISARKSYIEPVSIIDTVAKTIERHITDCRELYRKRESMQKEMKELNRYKIFLGTLESLLEGVSETANFEFIGITIKDPETVEPLRGLIFRLSRGRFELLTAAAEDGTLVGLITVERGISEKVKKSLSDEHIPELSFPPSFRGLTFTEKITFLRKRISEVSPGIEMIDREMEIFSHRWTPIYKRVMEWINERLSLLKATASVFETKMCFYIQGWMPSENVKELRGRLTDTSGGKVVLEEREMLEKDLEMVPVILRNPPFFRPFELFTKFLPLPRYTSYDPTPFMAIFFPVFFGMMLGDAGYGLVFLIVSLILTKRYGNKRNIQDAFRILLISSVYTIFFGILYGEFFGELPLLLFGLEPICIERRTAVLPMLYFALTVGMVHITIACFLAFISAIKKKAKRVILFKLINMTVILCVIALFASFFEPFPWLLTKPIIIAILILTPLLFFAGGILAPLELIKSIGNIISYARIMAIGLTSVLLAFVANRLAGMTGDIVIGVIVAGLLHLLNMILGVFSPTIHSMRLHYVEFFTKFLEPGGRKFEPMKKVNTEH
jgi:V/A-type H+-transporting ATPase subunit I